MDTNSERPIAWLLPVETGFYLTCAKHTINSQATPVFRENVYPYKGSCVACGTVLVKPQSIAWPELFDGK